MFLHSRARGHMPRPAGLLSVPGPYPVAQPSWRSIVIFVIIIVTIVWLLAQGYSINATLEAVAAACALATALVPCLAGSPTAAG